MSTFAEKMRAHRHWSDNTSLSPDSEPVTLSTQRLTEEGLWVDLTWVNGHLRKGTMAYSRAYLEASEEASREHDPMYCAAEWEQAVLSKLGITD